MAWSHPSALLGLRGQWGSLGGDKQSLRSRLQKLFLSILIPALDSMQEDLPQITISVPKCH